MRIAVTGTDTGVGKTVFCAALAGATQSEYWKPIQAGLEGGTDSDIVADLAGLQPAQIHPEAYRFSQPLSPHRAAELDGVDIQLARLVPPPSENLIVEGAGGALVPVTRTTLVADLFAQWNLPVIVVARTMLGTINHSLMTLECLRSRGLVVHGIAFVGNANEDSERTICEIGRVRRLGRLPILNPLCFSTLSGAFSSTFSLSDFR